MLPLEFNKILNNGTFKRPKMAVSILFLMVELYDAGVVDVNYNTITGRMAAILQVDEEKNKHNIRSSIRECAAQGLVTIAYYDQNGNRCEKHNRATHSVVCLTRSTLELFGRD